jgi:hypothetical protein
MKVTYQDDPVMVQEVEELLQWGMGEREERELSVQWQEPLLLEETDCETEAEETTDSESGSDSEGEEGLEVETDSEGEAEPKEVTAEEPVPSKPPVIEEPPPSWYLEVGEPLESPRELAHSDLLDSSLIEEMIEQPPLVRAWFHINRWLEDH